MKTKDAFEVVQAVRGTLKRDVVVHSKRLARRGKSVQCFVRKSSYKTSLILAAGNEFVELPRGDVEVTVAAKVKIYTSDPAYRFVVPEMKTCRGGQPMELFPLTMKNEN